ncbi:MAG: tripartite tricarboxylate transporter substrate binding protein [Betaproteobacteria bacterium]|nr:tripartite tricarboxylate transporter substrate binding protein [Betaproteobacteria bacterium]
MNNVNKVAMATMLAAVFSAAVPAGVQAQAFPSKPIRLVVPYGTGGGPDVMSRNVAQRLSETIGQQVMIDNRPGAGGVVAAQIVMASPPDGYTLFVADTGHFGINPALFSKLPYHPIRDFTAVTIAASAPLFLAVGAAVPAQNVRELLALSKNKSLLYGSSGNGSPHHLGMEMLKTLSGADMTHVPYKGVAQSVPAVLAGDVSAIFVGLPSIQPHAKAGKARIIAVSTAERTHLMPDLPTVAESGAPGFDLNVHIGYVAPLGTPREVVMKIYTEVRKVLAEPQLRARLDGLGIVALGTTPEEFTERIKADLEKYAKLVKDSGVRID